MTNANLLTAQLHEVIEKQLLAFELEHTGNIIEKLTHFIMLLHKWNHVHNLTAVRDPFVMVERHIADSYTVLPYLVGNRIIDVGTGAGVPGLPLAIVHPEFEFVLLDSNHKRQTFLKQVLIELELKNVELVCARVEEYEPQACFNSILTRAFAEIPKMLKKTKHLICKEGIFVAMKGNYPKSELEKLAKPFKLLGVHLVSSAEEVPERHIVCIGYDW